MIKHNLKLLTNICLTHNYTIIIDNNLFFSLY